PPPPDDNNPKVDNDVKTTTIAKFDGPVVNLREEGLVGKADERLGALASNPEFQKAIGGSIEAFAEKNVAGYAHLMPHVKRRINRAIAATIMSIQRSSNPPGVNLDELNPQALKTTLLVSASRAKTMDKLGSVQISNNPPKEGQEGCTGFIRNIYADFIKAFPTENKEAATGAGKLLEECMSKAGFNAEEANALHEKLNKSGEEVSNYAEGGDMMDILKSMRDTLREDNDPKLRKLERQLANEIDKRFQLQQDDDVSKLIASLPFSKRPKVDKAFKKLEIALDRDYSQRSVDKLFQKIDFMIEQKTKINNKYDRGTPDAFIFMHTATQPLREFIDQINEQLPATSADPGIQQLRAKILKPITQHVRKNIEVIEQRVAAFKNCQKDGSELVSTYSQKELPKGKNLGQQQYMDDFLSKAKYDTHITAYTSFGESISENINKFERDSQLLNNLPEMTRDLESTQKLAEEGSQLAKEGPTLAKETPQKFSFAIRNIMHRATPSEGEEQLSLGDTLNKLDPELKNTAVTILKQDVAHNPHPELTEKALEFAYSADRKALGEYCNKIGDEQADQLLETIAYLESGKNEVSSEEIQQEKQGIWISTLKQDENNPHPELTEKALEVLYDTTAAKSEEKYENRDMYLGKVFEEYKKKHTDDQGAVDDLMKTIAYLSKDKNKA
ncbi:MAG: hypothetical protein K2L24_00465, partial [Opitutales bacterium]|nr:hypothetical protein [Opitutales bacterium]